MGEGGEGGLELGMAWWVGGLNSQNISSKDLTLEQVMEIVAECKV